MHVHERAEHLHTSGEFLRGGSGIRLEADGRGAKRPRDDIGSLAAQHEDDADGRGGGENVEDDEDVEPVMKKLKGNITKLRAGTYDVMAKYIKKVARVYSG
jgi:hypothetical protein